MRSKLCSIEETKSLLAEGKTLLLAGEESAIDQLPSGKWIAGTIPYFMASDGGIMTKNQIFVTEVPDFITDQKITFYDEITIERVYEDGFEKGFTVLIIPATSKTHFAFALRAPFFKEFASKPLIGWIAGVDLAEVGKVTPKVYNGLLAQKYAEGAIGLHCQLPPNMEADINIINIFSEGNGDVIEFLEDGFSVAEALINGKRQDFTEYLTNNKIDTRYPLVSDYSGSKINASFQKVDIATHRVDLYAPVFKNLQYRLATPIEDYVAGFNTVLEQFNTSDIYFSCNCILNYVYGKLEGQKTKGFVGPVTFGEIAYQLLNQTLVYLKIYGI